MARKSKSKSNGGDGPTKGHNVADLNKLIRNCAQEATQIKRERQELNERMGDIRKKLKESGIQTAAFDFALRLMEQEADARAEYLDQLSVNFEALGIGRQHSFLADPAETAEQPTP